MNPMQLITQFLGMGNNPQQIMQNIIHQNPQMQVIVNQVQQSGLSPKQFVMQYAKQNNIDINPLVQFMSQRGIKL